MRPIGTSLDTKLGIGVGRDMILNIPDIHCAALIEWLELNITHL
jgi:hypothetical protein